MMLSHVWNRSSLSNQQEEWRSYRQQLIEGNSKKRQLMEIVKRKGLQTEALTKLVKP